MKDLLTKKDAEIRRLSKYLYEHDYLNFEEMDLVIRGESLTKEKEENKVRPWKPEYGSIMLKLWGINVKVFE